MGITAQSSLLSALARADAKTIACGSLLLGGVMMLALLSSYSVFATFPGENGKIAFYKQVSGKFSIYTTNQDGSGLTRLTENKYYDRNPSWSPDARKIVFDSGDSGMSTTDIYVMNSDGTGITRLIDDPGFDIHPAYSPDGSKIVFQSDRDGDYEIYVMNAADGSGLIQLTNNSVADVTPSWSPDGTKIAFGSAENNGGPGGLYVMNTDSTSKTRLTDTTIGGAFPSWSPDGTKIAFETGGESQSEGEIWVLNSADGSGQTRLTGSEVRQAGEPSWSPDGQKITFIACDSSTRCDPGEL
ncbi:MAG: hypothetical protein M3247_07195 [Thermoproteota archaeon]|nr:hypothetical protein [Thermoproteota archaeon]